MAAVLQGGFLLADKLCQTGSLSAAKKQEWSTVGRPIIDSLNELLCGQGQSEHKELVHRRKKILCVIWSKLLEKERGKDVETSWKENALFSVLSQLPDINRTVLFEVVKSMGFYKIYVELLLCLQQSDLCLEVEHLVQYITTDTTPEDAQLLLEVWRGLWRGSWGGTETFDSVFADQFTDVPSQAPKRARLDPDTSSRGVIFHLFQAVREIKDDINSFDLCCFALSNCLDSIFTSYLLGHQVELSAHKKLERLSVEVALAKQYEGVEKLDLVKVICEAQKDLTAVETPSKVKPAGLTLTKAIQTAICLLNVWEEKGLLKATEKCTQTRNALVLRTSVHRILQTLDQCSGLETEEGEGANELKKALKKLSEHIQQNEPTKTSFEMASIAMIIIDHRLEGFQQFIPLFVADLSWSLNGNDWISCLERNKNVLKQRELVMKLVSILIAKCQTDEDVQNCRRLKDLVVDLFCELPTSDQNDTLVDVISLSEKGLHGHLPQALTAGFSVELNLAFNCIIQGGAQSNSDAAVSSIARIAFQNPEATLRQCCHLAVVNLGAHIHLSKILKCLSGLGTQPSDKESSKRARGSLLSRCLQETVKDKLVSSQEQEQFLQFLGALMEPSGDCGWSFVPPHDVFQTFIFPYLSSPSSHHYSLELCLRLLHSSLDLKPQDGSSHWVMDCSPFPLLYCLCQLLNDSCRCWEMTSDSVHVSMESKEVLTSILSTLGEVVGKEVAAAPGAWSRALFWLYSKVEDLDWTVRFHLKALWGDHFKNEVPSSLLEVCDLPEHEWSGIKLDQYGQGTGLLAWLECCSISDAVQNIMLDSLSLDQLSPNTVSMFSKGLLLVLSQTLPWCTLGEWARLAQAVKHLLTSRRLHVPYSLEYAEFLPLLDLRAFACELRLSVLLLRVFQLLCSSSCADWLPPLGWAHVARLYASTVRETLDSLKAKLPHSSSPSGDPGPVSEVGGQEVLFVLTQLFCHVMHVHVMMPGHPEPLFLCALEILTLYETTLAAHPKSRTSVEGDDTRHFLKTITDNLDNEHMKSVLQQKITQL